MNKEEMKKNAEFLINILPKTEIPGSAKVSCRYKKMVAFAECFGYTDKKYIGAEDEIVACPGFANAFTVKAFYTLIPGIKLVQDGVQRDLLLDPTKLLHASNQYNWENCVPIRPGDRLVATAKYEKAWLSETMVVYTDMSLNVVNQKGELVCNVKAVGAIRPGGY